MTDVPPPFDILWFQALIGLVIGLLLGSFTTMLSYRVPRRLSIIQPRSYCPKCKKTLGVRDLVPLFSWLLYQAKCRYCGKKISKRYVFIEIATGVMCSAALVMIGYEPEVIAVWISIVIFVAFMTYMVERKKK